MSRSVAWLGVVLGVVFVCAAVAYSLGAFDTLTPPSPRSPDAAVAPVVPRPAERPAAAAVVTPRSAEPAIDPDERQPTVVVEVLGADGRPRPGMRVEATRENARPQALRTDASGRVRFRPPDHGARWESIRVPIVGGDVQLAIAEARGHDRPIVVRLPPVGTLRLEAFGADGARWPEPLTVRCVGGRTATFVGGVATLDPARADVAVEIVDRTARLWTIVTETVAGPPADGVATRRIDVHYAGRHLRGRALGPDGAPIATGALCVQSVFDRRGVATRGATRSFSPRDDGRFLIAMEDRERYRAMRLRWVVDDRLQAEAEVPIDGYVPHLDVGDVRLSAVRLLASGRVVWRGAMAAPESFRAWVELHPSDGERDTNGEARADERGQGFISRPAWLDPGTEFGRYAVGIDRDGRFAIHGRLAIPFTLCVRGIVGSADRRVVTPGATGIVLPVDWMREISGRVHVSEGIEPHELSIGVRNAHRVVRSEPVNDEGAFFVEGVPIGAIAVELRLNRRSAPILSVPIGTEVIDARGRVPTATIEVVDPDGGPIADATIQFDESLAYRTTDANGRAVVPIVDVPARVSADGYRRAVVAVRSDRRIVLPRGIPMRLRFDFGEPMPADNGGFVLVERVSDDPYAAPAWRIAAVVTPQVDTVDWVAEALGEHRVRVDFFDASDDSRDTGWSGWTDSVTIRVEEPTSSTPVFRLVRLSPPR